MHSSSAEPSQTDELRSNPEFEELTQILEQNFPKLKFPEPYESQYAEYRLDSIISRSILVAWFSLFLNLAYITTDFLLLPSEVSPLTIVIRAAIAAPVVAFLLVIHKIRLNPPIFMAMYVALYLISGIAVISISVIVRVNDVAIPYEGVLLIMMFGFLMMAIPFYLALAGAGVLFLIYSLAEVFLGASLWLLVYNVFFMLTANIIGAVGCYVQERSDRRNYLNDRLLQLARDSAEFQSVKKTHLIAEASHDLRQPLHAMTLIVEALAARPLDQDQKSLTGQLKSSLVHLNQLLGAMFDMSKLELGIVSPKVQSIDIDLLLEQVDQELVRSDEIKLLRNSRALNESPVFVKTDPVLLARMLRNLLENAQVHSRATLIEFGYQEGIASDALDESRVISIYVKDNGRGIPDTEQDKIFKSFYKGAADTGQGLGLGLSIVSNLAEMLEVQLGVESKVGQGTCFTVQVPISAEEPSDVEDSYWESSGSDKKEILLVDNEQAVLASASNLLERWGYEVRAFDQLPEAIASLKQESVDLVISDYHFDLGEAAESFIEYLAEQHSELPVILLTADTQISSNQFQHPLLSLFYKPIAPAKLRAALMRNL